MSFKVGDKVEVRDGGYAGTVEASNFAHAPARYLVSYEKENGVNYQDWFGEDALRGSDAAPETPPADPGTPAGEDSAGAADAAE